jgi:ABC-type phosphate transport system substrate-binding protein
MGKLLSALVLGMLLIGVEARAQDKSGDLAIIVNKSCSLDNVSRAELVKIFKGEKSKNPDGAKYVIIMRDSGSPERSAALRGIYSMSDAEYEKYFLQATFAGTVQAAPKVLTSSTGVCQFISSSPGAISYVGGGDADSSVKVVKVDGKAPGDAGYPLKLK